MPPVIMSLYKRKWHYAIVLSLLLAGVLASSRLQDRYFKLNKNLEIFADVLKELDLYYVDDIDPDMVVKTGIDAMLASLDPFTTFLSEEDLENFKTATTGEYGGIGALIGTRESKNMVMMLYKDCPAHKGGLRVGDEISQINGEDMAGKSIVHISSLLRGMPDTSVQLSVNRHGIKKLLKFTLAREQVILKDVPYYGQVKPGIGYIRLSNFTMHAAHEVQSAVENLKEEGAQNLILDLRGNPGGILEEAVKVVNLFIDRNLPVVVTKSKVAALAKTYTTLHSVYDASIPVIVLVDAQSASASEIVSGTLQDYDRAVLIGKPTFGKGLVQTTRPLSYNNQLKLTISKYYIPSGRSIQKIDHSLLRQEKVVGEAVNVPEKIFLTQMGRKVYENNGITPDIEAEKLSLAPITIGLIRKGLIFDYATVFQAEHKNIQPASKFKLSEAQYKYFLTWLKDKDYAYSIEPNIDELLQKAQGEVYTDELKKQIKSLKSQVQRQKIADLQKFKVEIKLILQEAIVMRYYFQEGAIKAMLPHDEAIQKACVLFQDINQYHQLLKVAE